MVLAVHMTNLAGTPAAEFPQVRAMTGNTIRMGQFLVQAHQLRLGMTRQTILTGGKRLGMGFMTGATLK